MSTAETNADDDCPAGLDEPGRRLLAIEAARNRLRELLRDCLCWMECDCGHPACKKCRATREARAELAKADA